MPEQATCQFCDHALDGRGKLFCTSCLPTRSQWPDRSEYNRAYQRLYSAIGRGDTAGARCRIPKGHPAHIPDYVAPREPRKIYAKPCPTCGDTINGWKQSVCKKAECKALRQREVMRRQHQRKKDDPEYRRKRKLLKYKRLAVEHRAKAEMYERLASGECVDRYKPIDIADRDGWICSLCGDPIDRDAPYTDRLSLSIDHVVPLTKGGTDELANLRAAHMGCNATKGNRTLPNGEQLRLIG